LIEKSVQFTVLGFWGYDNKAWGGPYVVVKNIFRKKSVRGALRGCGAELRREK
jgi:hypothetical protein